MHFDASENMKIVNVTCNIFLLHECFGNNGFYIPKAGGFLHPKGPKGEFLHPKGTYFSISRFYYGEVNRCSCQKILAMVH